MGLESAFTDNKIKMIIAYYLALIAVLLYLIRPGAEYPLYSRLILLIAIVLPAIIKGNILPAVMVLFYGIEELSFVSILPASDSYYVLVIVLAYLIHCKPSKLLGKELIILFLFFILALLHSDLKPVFLWTLLALLLGEMVKTNKDLDLLAYAFIVLSIFLSTLFLIYQGDFAYDYGDSEAGLERSKWINSNVFGACISAGGVLACAHLTKVINLSRTRLGSVLSITAIVLASLCLLINASRGALSSFIIPSLVLLLISGLPKWGKILSFIAIGAVAWWLYKSGFFDLLFYRIEIDETGTSNRITIWATKLADFFSNAGMLDWIIGIGQTACVHIGIGFGANWSTHNDFLTAFIAYGIIGLILFVLSLFVYPVFKASFGNKKTVFVLLLYLIIECFVLEPIFRGYFTVIMFFIFVLKYAIITEPTKIR